ncbi:hypothetical protein Plhal710r2_c055g0165241 [Plasmopara halstedii]
MVTRSKPSVFAAFGHMRVSDVLDSEDESAEERLQERKEKQKQKKKSRSKKKSSDSAQLKDLAFVSASKPRKGKTKTKKYMTGANAHSRSPSGSSTEEAQATNCLGDKREVVNSCEGFVADTTKPQQMLQKVRSSKWLLKSAALFCDIEKELQPTNQPQQTKVTSPPKQQQQQNIASSPGQSAGRMQSSSETELGAVYTPSHITITRVDGQMKRTVSVTEVMDQLLRYTQQNTQLLAVQEQLGHANRNLQDQLQRSAEIISGLQNEVTIFRQMCLNLQAEVSLLRSNTAVQIAPDASSNPQLQYHRPPPGMS